MERQMFAIIEEHYDKVTLKNNTYHISYIMIDGVVNLVHITLNYKHDSWYGNSFFRNS